MEHEETSAVNTSRLRRAWSSLQETAKNNWMTVTVFAIFTVLFVSVVSIVILGYILGWKWTGVVGKTFWDWLKLMIVPIVLGAGGYSVVRAFAWSDQIGQQQRTQESMREAQNTSRQASLDQISLAYLDRMESLLTEFNLRDSYRDDLRILARARTLNVLEALDPRRRGSIIRFLYDSHLINTEVNTEEPVIRLSGANLTESHLVNSVLSSAELSRVDFDRANLAGTYLTNANLASATLHAADLSYARLSGADLSAADLSEADLSDANLSDANLRFANLSAANLRFAKLREADLSEVDLSDANLGGAVGITKEELEQQAKTLEGATMPDGSKHD
jgi:uncharacterized protein YjbI with pentapeptide repeats